MTIRDSRGAFENVRNQIGCCGLWCGSCAVGNGSVARVARGLRDLLTAYDVPNWGTLDLSWESFLDAVTSLEGTISCVGCRKGGGRGNCEIRACADGRGVTHCTDCSSFGVCTQQPIVEHMRCGAARVGMVMLSPGDAPAAMIETWSQIVTRRWPTCLLFADSE